MYVIAAQTCFFASHSDVGPEIGFVGSLIWSESCVSIDTKNTFFGQHSIYRVVKFGNRGNQVFCESDKIFSDIIIQRSIKVEEFLVVEVG